MSIVHIHPIHIVFLILLKILYRLLTITLYILHPTTHCTLQDLVAIKVVVRDTERLVYIVFDYGAIISRMWLDHV